ncbi:MAG: O-antigen ligase family protein [Verrucomicrobiota bacterium]
MKATTPLILLPAAMLMGNSIAYICLAVIGLCSVSELRDQKCRGLLRHCFTENKWPWLVLSAFSLVFIIIQSVSPIADFAYVSELKWVGILILGLVPTAILIRELPSTKVDKISLLITILLTCFCVAVALIQVATKADPLQYLFTEGEGDARGRGLLRNPIPFGHLMACFFLIGCVVAALGATHSLWGRRAVLLGIGVGSVCFVGLLASQTRGAWAALPIAALAGLVCLPWRSKRVWFGAMSLFGLIGLAALLLTPSIRSRFASGFDPSAEANRQRLEHWHANWEILKDNPFGIGYSANEVLIESVF